LASAGYRATAGYKPSGFSPVYFAIFFSATGPSASLAWHAHV